MNRERLRPQRERRDHISKELPVGLRYFRQRASNQEAGLKFAHRNVTVSLPPEVEKSLAHADPETRGKILEAGAAAAGAAIQAEEEEKAKKAKL